ncbi:MAG TPA: 4-(cytidine 5'-diphospho)-2-C-methyl-D-erythritol kinase, partial [Bacteroidia bacterium]|nr:4-(cytidine 5'-diphospho)-2-C-methyl-D-erythritol kinase [Bacteroidia bacterium]
MLLFPNAKINLGLHVIEKRRDNFHNIETVFYPVPWKDLLEVLQDDTQPSGVTLNNTGLKIPGSLNENLCVKAYELISRDYPMPAVKTHLHKQIPTGAGLGGGSSDAAFFIRALSQLFELNLSWGELHHYAKQIGSDCSFFITNMPVMAEGKGDELEPVKLSLKDYHILIVHPGIHISTPEAYKMVKVSKPHLSLEKIIQESPVEDWKQLLKNDFEEPVFSNYPRIAALKEKMYADGAVYAAMSGSGSAVFGI